MARLHQAFWILVGFGFIAWFSAQAINSQRELEEIEKELVKARGEVEMLEQKKRESILQIKGLRDDPFMIEQHLRKETGKARPGEVPLTLDSVPKDR